MPSDNSISGELLEGVSRYIDYEILVSTPGIKEPDSDFMWASNFSAPVGVSFIGEDVFINLFLPEGSENEKNKKLFMTRVGAKLQDGLWQARRNLSELSGMYGSSLQMAVSSFKSLILDHSYIRKGRYYAHFNFNTSDLHSISSMLVSFSDQVEGFRVEYMKRLDGNSSLFSGSGTNTDVSAVTIRISDGNNSTEEGLSFVMATYIDDGIKVIAQGGEGQVPTVMEATDLSNITEGAIFFRAKNPLLTDIVRMIMSDFIVVYGIYGSAGKSSMKIVITIPTQQTTALLRGINRLSENKGDLEMDIIEITTFNEGRGKGKWDCE